MPREKQRIDQLLVARGLAESRQKAQALVLAGRVLVNEQKIVKAGQPVRFDAAVRILGELPFVSRGGVKLQAALDHFGIDVSGRVCADLGVSTGGFTDCLLQNGARMVQAFDVGKGQIAWKLRSDPRVVLHEGYNVRYISGRDLPEQLSVVTVDLSFISLVKVLEPLKAALLESHSRWAGRPADFWVEIVCLVKPQFEVGKGEVGKGGIVREPAKRRHALEAVSAVAESLGFSIQGSVPSPIAGSKGNQEFLLALKLPVGAAQEKRGSVAPCTFKERSAMNSPIRKLGLIFKRHDPRVHDIVTEMIPWLQNRGVEAFLDPATVEQFPVSAAVASPEELASKVDVVAVFGGDGTFLYAARLVANTRVPILGINLGSLGFLTEVKLGEMHAAFENLIAGQYGVEDRVLLEVGVHRGEKTLARYLALNDAVINKGALARIIELEISVNSELVTVTRADGLIISTPTGSTAYSISAGGPIVYPTLGAFIITPICPHTLSNRPVVVPDSTTIGVCMRHGKDVMLTVDGQVGMPLEQRDCIRLQKAGATIRTVQATDSTFFKLLREKLKWS